MDVSENANAAILDIFLLFFCANFSLDSCRGGPKLQNEYSNIKIGQEITSKMQKK